MTVLALDRITKHWGPVPAVTDVSLSVAAGERIAFVGSNGSGKTTLVRCALGLLACAGRARIFGLDVQRHPERALADVAYIPQIAPPLDATVDDLVRTASRLRARPPVRVAELTAALGVAYDAIARVRLRDLSGGTKQKLLAALALAAEPRLLVADEPTASLDTQARHAFFSLVAARPADSALVLCSHRTGEIRQLVNRVVELRDGRIVSDARLDDVVRGRAVCRIEVVAAHAAAAPILATLGFAAVTANLWQRTCTPAEKLDMIARLLEHRAHIDDVRVLDVDAWQVPP